MARAMMRQESDVQARLKYPKSNYFCYKWRVVDEFSKSVDRELHNMVVSGGTAHKSLINERIMALYKMSYRKTKNDFMSQITLNAMAFLKERRDEMSNALIEENIYTSSMKDLVESMYNMLLACSIELNTVLGFSELFIASTDPEIVVFNIGRTTKHTSFRARLSTNQYSLLLHGQKNKIAMYILPVEDLINLNHSVNGREPMKVIEAEIVDGNAIWKLDGKEVEEDALEDACLRCLHELVEATQKQLAHNAQFGQ